MAEQQKPGAALRTKSFEFVLEKFFDEYITVWYQERIVSAVQYDKARKEIDLLKTNKRNAKEKKTLDSKHEDITGGKQCQSNLKGQDDAAERPKSARRKGVSANAGNKRMNAASNGARNDETQHKKDLQSLRIQNEELTQEINRLRKLNESQVNAHYKLKEKHGQTRPQEYLQSLLLQNEELTQKINRLKEKLHEIRAEAHLEVKQKDKQIEKLTTLLENSRGHNDDLSKRLSKLAGDKLRQGNPDLADLSDRYRPTEVGKMFSEVYDNEWSDAFENIPNIEEDKKKGFKFCEDKFKEQTEAVRLTLLGLSQVLEEDEASGKESGGKVGEKTCISIRTDIQNVLKEIRKEVAIETAVNVANDFNMTLQQYVFGFGLKQDEINKPLRKFAYKCIELCWLMVLCDPPMALSEDKKDKPYDTNFYKPYTKSLRDLKNPVVALPVWPALRLHLGGPLVAKGVAQPGEGKSQK